MEQSIYFERGPSIYREMWEGMLVEVTPLRRHPPMVAAEPRVFWMRHDCATVCRKHDTIIQTGETIPCIKS